MNNAILYHQGNNVQRNDAKEVMEKYGPIMQWRSDGQDTLLDIGCGCGDVTMDFVLPQMPKNYKKLVGCDISEKMLEKGRSLYEKLKISFEKLDIGDMQEYLASHPEGFDHITSFYCLHWVLQQEKAAKNIYDLLKPQGDCLLIILANHPIFDVYMEVLKNSKWAPFMKNIEKFVTPYQYCKNPAAKYNKILELTGFSNYYVDTSDRLHVYEGRESFRCNMFAVNPFLVNMTPEQQNEYFEEIVNTLIRMGVCQRNENDDDCKFIIVYKLMIVYAQK